MPWKPARICGCGRTVPAGELCACQLKRERERKARADRNRPNAAARGYDSWWETERKAFLVANPVCRRCGAPATVVDHLKPHRGDRRLFRDRSNWQPLCTTCHSRHKQALEKREVRR